jgi:TraB/PrgY/gumN family
MKKIILLPVLLFAAPLFAQKQLEEKTLLWRISGNGVKAPSYLYGTMHLRDSRLFNFYDSLYTALEQCDRFAMEIQPDSLTNGLLQDINFTKVLFNRADEEDDEADLSFNKYIEEKLTKKEIDSLHAAAKAATGADKINYRKLIARKRLGYGEWEGTSNMPVFMDAWLFNVARKQGKEKVISSPIYCFHQEAHNLLPKDLFRYTCSRMCRKCTTSQLSRIAAMSRNCLTGGI